MIELDVLARTVPTDRPESDGLATYAVAAVDVALWDLKARLLGVSLSSLLGHRREAIEIYGSGGFTSYSERELCEQSSGWVAAGMTAAKMKVGRDPRADPQRVGAARAAIAAGEYATEVHAFRRLLGASSTSTTTCASSRCSSTECPSPTVAS